MRITAISDTHSLHHLISKKDLPGGDLLIFTGDLMNCGYRYPDITNFCYWFDSLEQYDIKVFIAGNHDRLFESHPNEVSQIINSYKWIAYLQDDWLGVGSGLDDIAKIWGSPWQPEFMNWAFNLPRNSDKLKEVWSNIPVDTDILVTHGPPHGYCDIVKGKSERLGCELLRARINELKPKIHIFGHIHTGYGYYFNGDTHFINASVLDERYRHTQKPLTFDWNMNTNELNFI